MNEEYIKKKRKGFISSIISAMQKEEEQEKLKNFR